MKMGIMTKMERIQTMPQTIVVTFPFLYFIDAVAQHTAKYLHIVENI